MFSALDVLNKQEKAETNQGRASEGVGVHEGGWERVTLVLSSADFTLSSPSVHVGSWGWGRCLICDFFFTTHRRISVSKSFALQGV